MEELLKGRKRIWLEKNLRRRTCFGYRSIWNWNSSARLHRVDIQSLHSSFPCFHCLPLSFHFLHNSQTLHKLHTKISTNESYTQCSDENWQLQISRTERIIFCDLSWMLKKLSNAWFPPNSQTTQDLQLCKIQLQFNSFCLALALDPQCCTSS